MDTDNIIQSISPDNFSIAQKHLIDKFQLGLFAKCKQRPNLQVAMRLRLGRASYAEWATELQCYLLPDFKHYNILPFLGSDKRYCSDDDDSVFSSRPFIDNFEDLCDDNEPDLDDEASHDEHSHYVTGSNGLSRGPDGRAPGSAGAGGRHRPGARLTEYWILNDFNYCITLRHYLRVNSIDWDQMLRIMRGILAGVSFLHNYIEHNETLNPDHCIDRFIRSTHGLLKKVSFRDHQCYLTMKPPFNMSIIHRNLSSMNIVLRGDFTPCIWNFGTAYIHYPFQPMQLAHKLSNQMRKTFMSSPYTPPEVLLGQGPLTLNSLRSIDMYACGILLWELMSRCVMPRMDNNTDSEQLDRYDPDNYAEPFEKELGPRPTPEMLKHVVVKLHVRPMIKWGWMVGKKTNKVVQIMQDLWDQDQEARLSALTAIIRLDKLALISSRYKCDRRNKYILQKNRYFDFKTMWPPRQPVTQAPLSAIRCLPNIVFEDCNSTGSGGISSSATSSRTPSVRQQPPESWVELDGSDAICMQKRRSRGSKGPVLADAGQAEPSPQPAQQQPDEQPRGAGEANANDHADGIPGTA